MTSSALQIVRGGAHKCCILCKNEGKSLYSCLIKMKQGEPTNGSKHLQSHHKEKLIEMAELKKNQKKVRFLICTTIIVWVYCLRIMLPDMIAYVIIMFVSVQ